LPDDSEETSTESGGIGPALKSGAGSAAGHEFQSEDLTGKHRVVATAMLITFLTVFISQNWWKKMQDFITQKTHGTTKTNPGG
jgi:hypothetical protein